MKSKFTKERVIAEFKSYYAAGHIPTNSFLREVGRNDLSNVVCRIYGGFSACRKQAGIPEPDSDSHIGWAGEASVLALLESKGYSCEHTKGVKFHYDLLINGCIRADVKTASFAKYGDSSGWFYRMGKAITGDIAICYRADLNDAYIFPWFRVSMTNVTITPSGNAHLFYKNNFDVLDKMIKVRQAEKHEFPECSRFKKAL